MASVSKLGWVLLCVAVIGATSSLFGPHGPQWGVDIGATGTVLFVSALWSGAWLLAKNPDRIFSSAWPIAERRAWVGLLFVLLIFLSYLRFMWALSLHDAPQSLSELPARHFIWNVIVLLSACSRAPLQSYGNIPHFTLIAESGEQFDSSTLAGTIWVAEFIFTNCSGPCPRMTSLMRQVQTRSAVKLVSFTVDPGRDTP